jgi:hypothetical protein
MKRRSVDCFGASGRQSSAPSAGLSVHGSCGHSAKDTLPHATMRHKAQAQLHRPGPVHVANHVDHSGGADSRPCGLSPIDL